MKPTSLKQRHGKWDFSGGGFGRENRKRRRLERRLRFAEVSEEVRQAWADAEQEGR